MTASSACIRPQAADGSWSVPMTLHNAGSYRAFADFSSGRQAAHPRG